MDEKLIKELGTSIRGNGLIESIVVRFKPREDGSLMLGNVRKVEGKGSTPSEEALEWCHKFMAPVEEIFSNNISPLRW